MAFMELNRQHVLSMDLNKSERRRIRRKKKKLHNHAFKSTRNFKFPLIRPWLLFESSGWKGI